MSISESISSGFCKLFSQRRALKDRKKEDVLEIRTVAAQLVQLVQMFTHSTDKACHILAQDGETRKGLLRVLSPPENSLLLEE